MNKLQWMVCVLLIINVGLQINNLQATSVLKDSLSNMEKDFLRLSHTGKNQGEDISPDRLRQLSSKIEHEIEKLNDSIKLSQSTIDMKIESLFNNHIENELIVKDIQNDEEFVFSQSVEDTLALGYLDKSSWQQMDDDIKKMSKEENRVFWSRVFEESRNGNLVIAELEEDL